MDVNFALIGKGLTPLIAPVSRRVGRHLIGEEILERRKLNETALQPVIQKAAEAVSERIKCYEPAEIDQICLFLTSAEAEVIVRQIYAAKLSGSQQQSFELIREEFLTSFSLYTNIPKDELQDSARLILDDLIEGCEEALQIAIDQGILSAHEAKSAFRHQIILDEIAAIQKNLDLLTAPQKPDIQAILKFEEAYRQQVGERHKHITPPYIDAAQKLPINRLYVCPNFVTTSTNKGEERETLKMPDFLGGIYRAVLLGNPGGGKSTFTLKLCHVLATCYSERLFAGREVTPILVVLRDYGAKKKELNCSILQFIEATANSDYQIQPPPKAFEYLLLNGRAVVIFDGLDELLDTSYRQEISSDVESFCNLYPSVPVLVTSREVGYEQAPLDPDKFEIFRLAPFDEGQVQEYATKWFDVNTDLTPEQRQQKVAAFLQESQPVPDLRSNPLLLALMCNIYRGEGYIPKNKPDVYGKCAEMLFERWDKGRGIQVPLPIKEIESQIKPTMMYLAHWIYSDEALQSGVTQRKLVAKAADYLCPKRFEDRDEAEQAAREFIEFCRGRAWVFTDTGTTKEGDGLYQFTHRTFLEYFTACYLVRMYHTTDRLAEVLLPKVAKQEWDVVAQLAFQLQNKNIEGAGDELLSALIEKAAKTEGEEAWNLLSFAVRCLEFMVPSPRMTRQITTACIERCIAFGIEQIEKEKDPEREPPSYESMQPLSTIRSLLKAVAENQATIRDSFQNLLVERIDRASEKEAFLSLEIVLHGGEFYLPESFIHHIFDSYSDRIKELYPKHFMICLKALFRGEVPLVDFIGWYGVKSIFCDAQFTLFPKAGIACAANKLLRYSVQMVSYSPKQSTQYLIDDLREIGNILLSSSLPWVSKQQSDMGFYIDWILEEVPTDRLKSESIREQFSQDSNALFGAFTLLAVVLEGAEEEEEYFDQVEKSKAPLFDFMRWIFLARSDERETDTDKVQSEMDRCGFSTEQQEFIWRWVRREINLVGEVAEEETVEV
ncbi:MAG: NACHT domain-containing protein [Coleofasciculus sp. C3-bin4]|nr:NACHT domain-containing protein [Coleofasciculus sp. C3-bin4]